MSPQTLKKMSGFQTVSWLGLTKVTEGLLDEGWRARGGAGGGGGGRDRWGGWGEMDFQKSVPLVPKLIVDFQKSVPTNPSPPSAALPHARPPNPRPPSCRS